MTTVPGVEDRNELGFNIGVERRAVHGPVMTQDAFSAFWVSPAINVCVPHFPKGLFTNPRAPSQTGEARFHGNFVYKDEPVWILAHSRLTARDPVSVYLAQRWPITLRRDRSFFMTIRLVQGCVPRPLAIFTRGVSAFVRAFQVKLMEQSLVTFSEMYAVLFAIFVGSSTASASQP